MWRSRRASTTSAFLSGLEEEVQASLVSAAACSIVIFKGACAITKGAKSSQCFGRARRPAFSRRSCSGEGRERTEDGQARRPRANLFKRALGHARRVVVHPEDEGGDGVDVATGEAFEHRAVLRGLAEILVHVGH